MIPFRDLQNLCDELRDKTENYCSISVNHNSFESGKAELVYSLYIAGKSHRYFYTVKEIKTAIRDILNPPEDDGVELKE